MGTRIMTFSKLLCMILAAESVPMYKANVEKNTVNTGKREKGQWKQIRGVKIKNYWLQHITSITCLFNQNSKIIRKLAEKAHGKLFQKK